jgi:hypothetical protein
MPTTTFPYNNNVPFGPNFPGDDQPEMLKNTTNIAGLIAVDHVGFNSPGATPNGSGGHHLQVTFDSQNVPGVQGNPQAVLYTNVGGPSTAGSVVSQLFYKNSLASFPISCVKAFVGFKNVNNSGGLPKNVTPFMQYNIVAPVVLISNLLGNAQQYTITLTPNIIVTTNPIIFAFYNSPTFQNIVPTYSLTGNVITLTMAPLGSGTSGHEVNVIVIEI